MSELKRRRGRPISSTKRVTIHQWLINNHPKTGRCDECGEKGYTEYAFTKHPGAHTRSRSDYRELCRSCHLEFDAWLRERFPAGRLFARKRPIGRPRKWASDAERVAARRARLREIGPRSR